jgi:hypothetical protein
MRKSRIGPCSHNLRWLSKKGIRRSSEHRRNRQATMAGPRESRRSPPCSFPLLPLPAAVRLSGVYRQSDVYALPGQVAAPTPRLH